MKISLERVDTRGIVLDLPGGEALALVSTTHLRGDLGLHGETTTLSDVRADEVVLGAVRVLLGELVLSSALGARLSDLGVELEQKTAGMDLASQATTLAAEELSVVIDDVTVRGRALLTGVKLAVKDDRGSLAAEHVELGPFSLRLGEVELATEAVRGTAVTIAWAPDFFRLDAQALEAAALSVVTPTARILASDVALSALAVDNGNVTLGRLTAGGAQVEATIAVPSPAGTTPPAQPEDSPREPLVDLRLLDGLSGQLDVDVELDLTVPIIGHRRATHRLRVAIDRGTIDYRALEKNLSALEDAILDFSVRDGGLVLERVNPLFPTRGHGKPVVLWALDAADLELANQDRVRLVVLSKPELAGSDEPRDPAAEPKKSAIALQQLVLRNIDARLALAPIATPLTGQLRPKQLGALTVRGDVSYDPGTPMPPGVVQGELEALAMSVHRLALGASTLQIGSLELSAITALEMSFADVHPTMLRLELVGLVIADLSLGPAERPTRPMT